MTLWTAAEAEAATLGHAGAGFAASGLSIDTRSLKPGDLFVALKGDTRDGHDFVRAALARGGGGAAAVSVSPFNATKRSPGLRLRVSIDNPLAAKPAPA